MQPYLRYFAAVLVAAAVVPLNASAALPSMKVTEMTVTTKIYKGEPVDSVKRLSPGAFKGLYCFTRVESPGNEDTSIKHVWYWNDELIGAIALPVKGEHWRTYSKKTIDEGASGTWRVDALDNEGNVLRSVRFTIN